MQEIGANLGPTRANMVARGQLGVNMYLGKPEKFVFCFDGSTIFTKLYVSPWTRFGRPLRGFGRSRHALGGRLGRPWGRLGRPWGHLGGPSWRTLEKPWKNSLEEPSESTLTPKTPRDLKSTSFSIRGREASLHNYVVNTYSRSRSRSSSSSSSSSSIRISSLGNMFFFSNQGGILLYFSGAHFRKDHF